VYLFSGVTTFPENTCRWHQAFVTADEDEGEADSEVGGRLTGTSVIPNSSDALLITDRPTGTKNLRL